jgi:hypothetical protein
MQCYTRQGAGTHSTALRSLKGTEPKPHPAFSRGRSSSLGGGQCRKLSQQFSDNSNRVREVEKRLAIQHTFIERLRASGKDSKSAEDALEVIRDIQRELYNSRTNCDAGL